MYKHINIRFNLSKEEHKKAWEYMQHMDKQKEKSYSHFVIKLILLYFSGLEENEIYTKKHLEESLKDTVRNTIMEVMQQNIANMSKSIETKTDLKNINDENDIGGEILDMISDMW